MLWHCQSIRPRCHPHLDLAFRLSQPQLAGFVAGLDDAARKQVVDECVAAVAATGEALDPAVVLLAARA